MFVNVKLDISKCKSSIFKVANFIHPVPFQWHIQNKIGNIGILVS